MNGDQERVDQYVKLSHGNVRYRLVVSQSTSCGMLFIHGFTSSLNAWEPVIKSLIAANPATSYLGSIISFDFYGHGKSDLPAKNGQDVPMTFDLLEGQILELLGHVNCPKDLILVGHSQGGVFCASFAQKHSDRIKSLVLITPGGVDFHLSDLYHTPWHVLYRSLYVLGSNWWTQVSAIYLVSYLLSFLTWLYDRHPWMLLQVKAIDGFFTNNYLTFYRNRTARRELKHRYLSMVASMLSNLDLLRDKRSLYERLVTDHDIPIDLILGTNDPIVTLKAGQRLSTLLDPERDRLHILEDASHLVPYEKPDEIASILLKKLS